MAEIADKRIVLGVTGGIAAYKAAELTRLLRRAGAQVRVVMTPAATAFVTPLTFQALSGQPVHTGLLDPAEESAMGHIELARWADAILIAPATADCIARLRAGMANDLLSALCLACDASLILAPAMNRLMWLHPATRENIACLEERGATVLGPAEGEQACGETGPGRMLEPADILSRLHELWKPGALSGVSILISAGPTREPIDPVRYLSNRSTGKMGYSLAEAATAAGARVCLVSGPTALPRPKVNEFIAVESCAEMHAAIMARVAVNDIYIGTAAVADYRPASPAARKMKKSGDALSLTLEQTPDILAEVACAHPRPFTVGFAAETHEVERYARDKLTRKRLDMIAANQVGGEEGGFESDSNALFVCWADGETRLPMAPKPAIAAELTRLIAHRYHAAHPTQDS